MDPNIDMASMSADDLRALGLRLLKTSKERVEAQRREEMMKTCTIPIRDHAGKIQYYEVQRGHAEILMDKALNDGSNLTLSQLIDLLKKKGVTEIELEFKETSSNKQGEDKESDDEQLRNMGRIKRIRKWLREDHRLFFNKGDD